MNVFSSWPDSWKLGYVLMKELCVHEDDLAEL